MTEAGSPKTRLKEYWRSRWTVPEPLRPFVHALAAAYIMYGMVFLWIILSLIPAYHRWVAAVSGLLPAWFPIANVFLAPVLLALVGGPLFCRPLSKLLLAALMLFSLSALGLLYSPAARGTHQASILISYAVLYLEAFLLIPWWNRQDGRRLSRKGVAGAGVWPTAAWTEKAVPTKPRKHRIRDLLVYVVIALIIVSFLVAYVLTR